MKMMIVVALILVGVGGFLAGQWSASRTADALDMRARVAEGMVKVREDQLSRAEGHINAGILAYPQSEIVHPALAAPEVGFGEYPWIDWLRSRVHFRQPDGMTIVGHDALVAAVTAVNRMHGELLECRSNLAGSR